MQYDIDTADYHNLYGHNRNHADTFPALFVVPVREADAKVCAVSRLRPSCGGFGQLVIYCLKSVNVFIGSHGIPEFLSIARVVILHLWKRQMLLSLRGEPSVICCWCSLFFDISYQIRFAFFWYC